MKEYQLLNQLMVKAKKDRNLYPSHLSLLLAIYYEWQNGNFRNPISITRKALMFTSKIKSIATYHKCIKDLNNSGYLLYKPSYNPMGSYIHWPVEMLDLMC